MAEQEQEKDVFDILDEYMDEITEGVGEELDEVVNKISGQGSDESDSTTDKKEEVKEDSSEPESLIDKISKDEEEEEDEDLDFGDMPNGKIRYEKARKQIEKLKEQIAQKEEMNSEDMSDEDESLNDSEIENLKRKVDKMEEEKTLGTLKQREDNFWKAYTPAERAKYAPMMELEVRRNDLTEHVLSGKLSLEKVMAMVNPSAVKAVQNPSVISSTKNPVSARTAPKKVDLLDKALKVYDSPKATNEHRKVANDIMAEELMKDFI